MVVPLGFIMSRLDSMIRRLEAQRTCLESAIGRVATFQARTWNWGLGMAEPSITSDKLRQIVTFSSSSANQLRTPTVRQILNF